MSILFLVLIVLSSVILAFIILIQNPKGGGLSGNVGGIGNQFMGVKQTTDTLERGTWLFAGIIAVLAIFSTLFLKGGSTIDKDSMLQKVPTSQPAAAPAQNAVPVAPANPPQDSGKK
ncbi:MAG: preprotein translocase subunit SecG [Chitinophagaceae bacterium]|jgi:preprotein translocase subunit SecG|nr:preprotein translocase subunit SecG [Chitinophagaceae bacterium]MCE2974324.1 preprotein translocase subunit SecG [Sediminibacterium sp.]MCA6472573.1 preprotein translocase subunit SecG [Chitinophagaceae bacterium]MCA6474871.1 preprotein translocase subunit SecG [Chitinophagaceae bacterium]MCA6487392.1 preprotein translocase subunit SecG [Chitinophagaceae bacterium]